MKPYHRLPSYKTVVGQTAWELLTHVVAYIVEIERLKVTVPHGIEEYLDGHNLAVGH